MPITLTDEQLSRWIAESQENPPFDSYVVDLFSRETTINPWTKDEAPAFRSSPKEFWRQRILYNDTIQDHEWNQWQPRDMVNDTAMNDMLLESMATSDWYIEEGWDPCKKEWTTAFMRRGYAEAYRVSGPNRRRNRAEAFALANGYHEDAI